MNIAAISVAYPGVLRVLQEGHKLGLWDGPDGSTRTLPESGVVILGAWHQAYEGLLSSLRPDLRIGVLWTSSSGEVGFEPSEQESLKRILDDKRISFVWFGHKPLADLFPEKGFYAPYPFAIPDPLPEPKRPLDYITLFCPPTVKKNIFNQLCAAAMLWRQAKLRLVTNVPVPTVLRDRLPSLQTHDWLPEKHYRDIMAGARVNLAVSWAETLHYQSLEAAIYHGVPSVGSKTIPWMQTEVAHPNDPVDIAEMAMAAASDHRLEQHRTALNWARAANAELAATLKDRLG